VAVGGGNTGDGGDVVVGAGPATQAGARGGDVEIRAGNCDPTAAS
jgi:hypothetical protein